jgi:hypothetical protein
MHLLGRKKRCSPDDAGFGRTKTQMPGSRTVSRRNTPMSEPEKYFVVTPKRPEDAEMARSMELMMNTPEVMQRFEKEMADAVMEHFFGVKR